MELSGPSSRLQVALAVLLGLATIGYGAYSYQAQTSALDDTTMVDATLLDVSVEKHSGKGDTYSPVATYNYTYEGRRSPPRTYPGTLPREFGSREKARDQIDGGARGHRHRVRPDRRPGNAFLEHEQSDKPLLVVGFGVLFVLGAAYYVLRGATDVQNSSSPDCSAAASASRLVCQDSRAQSGRQPCSRTYSLRNSRVVGSLG